MLTERKSFKFYIKKKRAILRITFDNNLRMTKEDRIKPYHLGLSLGTNLNFIGNALNKVKKSFGWIKRRFTVKNGVFDEIMEFAIS